VWSPDPSAVGLELTLDGATHEIGRESASIRDPRMSRRHLVFEPGPEGEYMVRDLRTSNGTWLDGHRVEGAVPLAGRVVSAGSTLFVRDVPPDPDHFPVATFAPEVTLPGLVGSSSATRELRRCIATVARMEGTVLILGPTGAGKELTARALHDLGDRTGEFVPVNCAAIPAELAESEFFGYVRGAFTGADREQPGLFERASGGTLFLDEVGDLPVTIQAKLLRVLEDSVVRRLGDTTSRHVDLRVVAATHVDLDASGFRSDLLARLEDWTIRIPPLADRKADIPDIWDAFFADGEDAREMTPELREALLLHDWPMNVRELARTARRVRDLVAPGEMADIDRLPRALAAPLYARQTRAADVPELPPSSGDDSTPGREVIVDALRRANGNVKQAAIENDWHRTQLYRWMTRLGIDKNQFRSES
jgi:DNA-binding NtrC family response regulator